jgi:DnaJ-class molecular chaperone
MKTPTLYCDDGSEIELPFKWEICSTCRGNGKSSAYLGAFTRSEMDEEGPEFMEDYMAGHYDRTCDDCNGSGKIKRVDWSKLTKEQKREWNAQVRADNECAEEAAWERRMLGGCG